jgi:hypothetical protein
MPDQIIITTSPEDKLPVVTLTHRIYGQHEINVPDVALRDHDDVRLAAEISLDLHDRTLQDLPVIDMRSAS